MWNILVKGAKQMSNVNPEEIRMPFALKVQPGTAPNTKADVEMTKKALKYKEEAGHTPLTNPKDIASFMNIANAEYRNHILRGCEEAEALSCATRIAQARV
jgi:hypothetical protein